MSDYWGTAVFLMLILNSSYPFYFICLFCAFLLVYLVLFASSSLRQVKNFGQFLGQHRLLVVSSVLVISIAITPLYLFKILNTTGEINSSVRHTINTKNANPLNAGMDFNQIAYSDSLADVYGGWDQFAHFSFFTDHVAYLPLFAYILLMVSLPVILDRKKTTVFLVAFLIYLTGLGGATPLYRFLYDHVFFFRYFRNLFFFIAYLMPLTVLFVCLQLQAFEKQFSHIPGKIRILSFLGIVHICFYALLRSYGCIFMVSYVTVLLSFLLFVLWVCGGFQGRGYLKLALLFFLIVLEPIYFFNYYRNYFPLYLSPRFDYSIPATHDFIRFEYLRPDHDNMEKLYGPSLYSMYPILASFKDSSGSLNFTSDVIQKYALDFYRFYPAEGQKDIIRHKIILYDRMPPITIGNASAEFPARDSKEIKILRFDANSLVLRTDFASNKFLVYNDTYSKFWKAFINGKETKVDLVQYAFKGVSVAAGKNQVEFRYCPMGGQWIYVILMGTFAFSFIFLLLLNFCSIFKGSIK